MRIYTKTWPISAYDDGDLKWGLDYYFHSPAHAYKAYSVFITHPWGHFKTTLVYSNVKEYERVHSEDRSDRAL